MPTVSVPTQTEAITNMLAKAGWKTGPLTENKMETDKLIARMQEDSRRSFEKFSRIQRKTWTHAQNAWLD